MNAAKGTEPLIRFQKADLGYRGASVLRDVTLDIGEGEAVGLVGPNGAGKTTFLRTALGLLTPRSGEVTRRTGPRFAYVPQADGMDVRWPLTIRQTVALAQKARRWGGGRSATERRAVEEALERTGVLPIADRLLGEVSGGQRQRAVLAQALCQSPDVLVLDEPTKGLDVMAERDLLDLIAGLRSQRLTILLVSHSLQIPLNFTDRILLFAEGRVVDTTPGELTTTNRLEEIYGAPFAHVEQEGMKWAMPRRRPQ